MKKQATEDTGKTREKTETPGSDFTLRLWRLLASLREIDSARETFYAKQQTKTEGANSNSKNNFASPLNRLTGGQ
jgi:hypothetical protein